MASSSSAMAEGAAAGSRSKRVRALAWIVVVVAAFLGTAFAFILDQPRYGFLHHAQGEFALDCSLGPCVSSYTYVVDTEYDNVVQEAANELMEFAVKRGSAHIGEYIFSRDGTTIHISFWYKQHGDTSKADEPPTIDIARAATWSDRVRGWWEDVTNR